MEINLKHEDLAMWVICSAIGKQSELIDKIEKKSEKDSILTDVKLIVGGVELDFNNVVVSLQQNFDIQLDKIKASVGKEAFEKRVADKVKDIIDEKYNSLLGDLYDIQERLESHKEVFKYEWE